MNSEIYVDTVVIGSGILGLSIAYYISKKFPNMTIAVLEKNPTFGVETSSRNSEVIHAGIYYKKDGAMEITRLFAVYSPRRYGHVDGDNGVGKSAEFHNG